MSSWKPALSASRAKEYDRCPLQYRLHVVDKILEPPTRATTMGTLVHSVLEHLFDAPARERTNELAQRLLSAQWEKMRTKDPKVMELFSDDADFQSWFTEVGDVTSRYFSLEEPAWLEPFAREKLVDAVTSDGIRLRGFIDRIDRAPDGALRVVDYKTGKAPAPRFQEEALFQMRFYALLLAIDSQLPARMQLVYIKSGRILTLDPRREDIARFQEDIHSLWERIEADARRGEFSPRKNPLCNWCGVRAMCPLFDGVTPELSPERIQWLLGTRVRTDS